MLRAILFGICMREVAVDLMELNERKQIFRQAREYADSLGKPLLVVGSPKVGFSHPCGDVTIDTNPDLPKICDCEIADVRNIPYPDGYFGAALASHILEHLSTIEDAFKALDELERVADKVFVVSPHKTSLMAWFHPEHRLWVTPSGDGYIIEQRGKSVVEPGKSYVVA